MAHIPYFFSYIWKKWGGMSLGEDYEFAVIVITESDCVKVWLGLVGSSKFRSVGNAVVLFIKKLN